MVAEIVTMCEIIRQAWPDGRTLVAELIYRLDEQGQVQSNTLAEHQRAALQALVDYRSATSRGAGRSQLSEALPEESLLYDSLCQTLLLAEQRVKYAALDLVRTVHEPFALFLDVAFALEIKEDGSGLVEVTETGPDGTTLHTLYALALSSQAEIVQAFSPCGEYSSNHQFQQKGWHADERKRCADFSGQGLRGWQKVGLGYWLAESEV